MIYKIESSNFETEICRNLQEDPNLSSRMIALSSKRGHPVYSTYYTYFEKYLMYKVNQFNSILREYFPLNHTKTGAFLDTTIPIVGYYQKKFPENLFQVTESGSKDPSFILKPACCGHAFSIWASQKRPLRKEILHQVSDCYRKQNTGTMRKLSRNIFFTMPDYHLLTVHDEALKDFKLLRSLLIKFHRDLFKNMDNFFEITRFVNFKGQPRDELIHEDNLFPLYYQAFDLEENETPYYHKKWELSYRGSSKIYTLATVQLDSYYPRIFKVNQEYGPRMGIHFTMGSLQRLVQTMILELIKAPLGVKLVDLLGAPMELEGLLNPDYGVLIEKNVTNLSKALSKSYIEGIFFPYVVLRTPKEWITGDLIFIDRLTKKQETLPLESVKERLKHLEITRSHERYYTDTLK